jgi:isopenicillin-N epimerase
MNFRDEFLLDPNVIFLNHGSFGACPRPVFEEYRRWQVELERQPVEFLGRRFNDEMRAARTALAEYVHAPADDLVFVPNATTGLNIVARSLDLQPGDEILATDHEYGAIDRTWRFLCAKSEAIYVNRALPYPLTSPSDVVETVWARVTPRTRVISISHITSPTALIFPIRELIRRAREQGILSVIDGAHVPGQLPLDLLALDPDFYSGNCHKWMCTPKGSAFLYARRDKQSLVEPLVVSWGWESATPGPSRFVEEQEWQGTRDVAAFLAVPAAIRFLNEHNWEAIRKECHSLAQYARQSIEAFTGEPALSPDSTEWYAQMVAVPLPPCDAESLKRCLYDEYRIEVPIVVWNDKTFVRISIQAYNTRADLDALVEALKVLIPQVRK